MNAPHRMTELFWLSDGGSDLSPTRNVDIEHTIEPTGIDWPISMTSTCSHDLIQSKVHLSERVSTC